MRHPQIAIAIPKIMTFGDGDRDAPNDRNQSYEPNHRRSTESPRVLNNPPLPRASWSCRTFPRNFVRKNLACHQATPIEMPRQRHPQTAQNIVLWRRWDGPPIDVLLRPRVTER